MAKRKSSGTRSRKRATKAIVLAAPRGMATTRSSAPQVVAITAPRRGGGRRRSGGAGCPSVTSAAVKGAVLGFVAVKYLSKPETQKKLAESEFVQDNGIGPYVAAAGFAVTKFAPKYRQWGMVAVGIGAFLWAAKKANMQEVDVAKRVQVQGPTLEDLARADAQEEAARAAAQ